MKGVSVSRALGAGFRLIGREPGSALAWLVFYVLYGAVQWGIMLAVVPGLFGQYAAIAQGATPDTTQMLQSAGAMFAIFPVIMILGVVFAGVLAGAIYRAILEPEDRRFAYLRLGRRELWLMLSLLVWGLLCFAIYLAVMIPTNLVSAMFVGAAGMSAGGNASSVVLGGLAMIVAVLAGLVAVFWFALRLAVGLPQSFHEARFVAFGGWTTTRGQGVKMLWLALAMIGVVVAAYLGVILMALIALGASGGFAALSGGAPHFSPVALVVFIPIMVLFGVTLFVFLTAAPAEIYRELKGEGVADVF